MDETTEELLDNGSVNDETIETGDDENPDDTQDTPEEKARKNKSNWKKVSEKAKQADILAKQLEDAQAEIEEWRALNPDIAQSKTENKRMDSLETRLFFAENPEAKAHKDRIDAVIAKSKNTLSRDDAWELIKPSIPKESESNSTFSTKSPAINTKKKLDDMNEEEALKLPKDQYAKWASKKYGF